jgi:hypothetical protein
MQQFVAPVRTHVVASTVHNGDGMRLERATCWVWCCLLLGCSNRDLKLSVTAEARFFDDPTTDQVPPARSLYPTDWDTAIVADVTRCSGASQWIAGVDWQNTYAPQEGALSSSERLVQRLTLTRDANDCAGNTRNEVSVIVEMFNPNRSPDTLSAVECTEVDTSVTWSSEVAIVDLDDLDDELVDAIPAFPDGQNAIAFRINDVYAHLSDDQVEDLEDELDSEATLTWNASYSYAGCVNNAHLWSMDWSQPGGGGGRNAMRPPRGQR